jgi:glutaredoxin
MFKSKKLALLSTAFFLIVLSFAAATIRHEKEKSSPPADVIVADSPIVFYYGYNCPHCELVEEYLEKNGVAEKVKFSKKEVYKNKDNAAEAVEKAGLCGISADKLGVPFLWDGERCYMGDQNIMDFFDRKMAEAEKTGEVQAADAALAAAAESSAGAADAGTIADKSAPVSAGMDAVLYYSESCPHCKIVEEYIETNHVGEKIKFAQKEISQTAENREDFIAKAGGCGIAKENMGVPMLYLSGKCYLGEQEIINFFKEKTNED